MALSADLAHQPLQRVPQMPLAQVQLSAWEARADGVRQAGVVVADDPRRRPVQGAQERLPVGLRLARERLQPPQLRASGLVTHRAEDAKRDPVATADRITHPERQVVQQQRPRRGPLAGAVGLKDDRREDLHPGHHQRSVARGARLAAARMGSHPASSLSCHQRRLAVARTAPDHLQRTGDPACDELVAPRRVWTLVEADRALARPTRVLPGLLARQRLSEPVRTIAVGRDAPVALAPMPRRTVVAIDPHPRPGVLGPGTDRLGAAPRLAQ